MVQNAQNLNPKTKSTSKIIASLALAALSLSCGAPTKTQTENKRQSGKALEPSYSQDTIDMANRIYHKYSGLDIVDGSTADQNTLTSTVRIVGIGGICSGTVIENGKIASAKHCFRNGKTSGLAVVFGGNLDQGQIFPVADLKLSNTEGFIDDVALLTLDVDLPSFAKKIPLAPPGLKYSNGDMFTVAGFGTQQNGQRLGGAGVAKQAQIQLTGQFSRQKLLRTTYGDGQACFGDSGGPVYVGVNGTRYLAGVVSRGSSEICKTADMFAVDTRYYRDFFLGSAVPETNAVNVKQAPAQKPVEPVKTGKPNQPVKSAQAVTPIAETKPKPVAIKSQDLATCLQAAQADLQSKASSLASGGTSGMQDFLSVAQKFIERTRACLKR